MLDSGFYLYIRFPKKMRNSGPKNTCNKQLLGRKLLSDLFIFQDLLHKQKISSHKVIKCGFKKRIQTYTEMLEE